MKAIFLKWVSAMAMMSAMALAGAQPAATAQADNSQLAGTWRVTVTIHNCRTGAPVGMPFKSLLSFAWGGTLTETTANPMFFPAERGPGHGVWARTGEQSFTASSEAFITVNGTLVKRQIISQKISVDGDSDHFASNATVEFLDPAGALLMQGCATATGERYR